jgi:hypothetical protein
MVMSNPAAKLLTHKVSSRLQDLEYYLEREIASLPDDALDGLAEFLVHRNASESVEGRALLMMATVLNNERDRRSVAL